MSERTWNELLAIRHPRKKCALCGEINPDVLEKHHITYSPPILIDLCANCHTIVTRWLRRIPIYEDGENKIRKYKKLVKAYPETDDVEPEEKKLRTRPKGMHRTTWGKLKNARFTY